MDEGLKSADGALVGLKLAFTIKRYADPNGKPLWRLLVFNTLSADLPVEEDASRETLLNIKRFAERAIETIANDGGRRPQ